LITIFIAACWAWWACASALRGEMSPAFAPSDAPGSGTEVVRVHAGLQPGIGDVAYTNNDADCTTAPACPATSTGTMLFDVDAALDQLAQQVDANGGVLRTVGPLGQPTKAQATGFDVYTRTSTGTNWAFVSLFDKGRTTFYEIDLATGQPITVTAPVPGSGKVIATRPHVTDIALAPAQAGF